MIIIQAKSPTCVHAFEQLNCSGLSLLIFSLHFGSRWSYCNSYSASGLESSLNHGGVSVAVWGWHMEPGKVLQKWNICWPVMLQPHVPVKSSPVWAAECIEFVWPWGNFKVLHTVYAAHQNKRQWGNWGRFGIYPFCMVGRWNYGSWLLGSLTTTH